MNNESFDTNKVESLQCASVHTQEVLISMMYGLLSAAASLFDGS